MMFGLILIGVCVRTHRGACDAVPAAVRAQRGYPQWGMAATLASRVWHSAPPVARVGSLARHLVLAMDQLEQVRGWPGLVCCWDPGESNQLRRPCTRDAYGCKHR